MNRSMSSTRACQVFIICLLSFTWVIPANADVKIVYPFAAATLPNTDPAPGNLSSHYAPFSFMAVCPGGPNKIFWEINNEMLGEATFYDQITVQFIHKLPGGGHHLKVQADRDCGIDEIKFTIGN